MAKYRIVIEEEYMEGKPMYAVHKYHWFWGWNHLHNSFTFEIERARKIIENDRNSGSEKIIVEEVD